MCSTCTPAARSAPDAPSTAELIARAPCEPPVTISTGPPGAQAEPLPDCAAQRGPVKPGDRQPQRDPDGGGVR